jgi:sulfopyruvate decarboxylase subunit beta
MNRIDAMHEILKFEKNAIIISANGFISRDLYHLNKKHSNFYMIGSMGLASSIGLGVALKNPKKQIFVFDGDGNILMNLGSLTTIGTQKPKNLIHFVFDNSIHESTGGQPTNTEYIKIQDIARACNYRVFFVKTQKRIKKILDTLKHNHGPVMIVIKIQKSDYISTRVELTPLEIRNRFMMSLKKEKN